MTKLHAHIGYFLNTGDTNYSKHLKCTNSWLTEWLEFQFGDNMNWNNYGEKWEIDHILPYDIFDLTSEKELCCNWTNLQPICKVRNKKKSNKIQVPYFMNSIVMVHRFIQKNNPTDKDGYKSVNERLNWLKLKLGND
jgi:hypothetical protein